MMQQQLTLHATLLHKTVYVPLRQSQKRIHEEKQFPNFIYI